MGENISHSLDLLELRVKLPHLQILVILFTIGYLMEGTLKIVYIEKEKKISSVQFLSFVIFYRMFSEL